MTDETAERLERLESQLPEWMEIGGVSGAAVAVIESGDVIWTRGFGVTSAATGAPVQADTVFHVGSLAKPVLAYAALRLVEAGRLELDRPLDTYLPAPYLPGDAPARTITARHVLSHTSGLPNWRFEPADILSVSFMPGERFSTPVRATSTCSGSSRG
jgi:CubicO group peptidase (beta-lactamase class C family)